MRRQVVTKGPQETNRPQTEILPPRQVSSPTAMVPFSSQHISPSQVVWFVTKPFTRSETWSYFDSNSFVLCCPVACGAVLSCAILYPILSYPILSYPILSYAVLCYPMLSTCAVMCCVLCCAIPWLCCDIPVSPTPISLPYRPGYITHNCKRTTRTPVREESTDSLGVHDLLPVDLLQLLAQSGLRVFVKL